MAGDGKSTAGPSATSTARVVTSRRTNRFTSARSATRSFNLERPPVILEIGSTVWRVGYAEQFQPQHLIRLEDPIFDPPTTATATGRSDNSNNNNRSTTKTESEWYLILAPVIEQMYDRLMCKPSTRRVVCLYHRPYGPRAFQTALDQHLWNRGVPALVRLDTLQVVPVALGWKRGLMVQVSREETTCVCHADGYVIPYTYQIVPTGYRAMLVETRDSPSFTATYRLPSQEVVATKMKTLLLNENDPNSLVVAILACLQECPRDLRSHMVSNIVFCGDGVALLPDLARLVVKRVQQILEGTPSDEREQEDTTLQGGDSTADGGSSPQLLTRVPIDVASLRPLASKVTLTSCAPHRADWIAWVGASLWAATWNKYDDDETPIPWEANPTITKL